MARQSDLLLQALAATPADLRRSARRCGSSADAAALLAGLIEEERRVREALRAGFDGEAEGVSEGAPQDDGARGAAAADAGDMAERFGQERAETLVLLRGLPVGGWARSVSHPEAGETRVHALVRRLVEHDTGELARLVELTPRGGGA